MASVAEIIRRYQVEIVAEWTAKAQTAASARGLSGPTFTNVMPLFLESLADGAGLHVDAAARRRGHVLGHLAARIRQGFELSEMVAEFDILERCIVRACTSVPAEDRPTQADVDRLHTRIQDAIMQLNDAFFHHMVEDEQSEKRYMRLLQDIANEALHDDRRPLRDRLHDVLAVVVEAMDARTAAILLFEVRADRLVAVASFGSEVFEAYARLARPQIVRRSGRDQRDRNDDIATSRRPRSRCRRRCAGAGSTRCSAFAYRRDPTCTACSTWAWPRTATSPGGRSIGWS